MIVHEADGELLGFYCCTSPPTAPPKRSVPGTRPPGPATKIISVKICTCPASVAGPSCTAQIRQSSLGVTQSRRCEDQPAPEPVGEARPVRRVEPPHWERFAEGGTWIPGCSSNGVCDEIGHGEHRRPGVEGVSVAMDHTSATRQLFSLHHSYVVPASCQITRGRQASQSGADHHNRVHLRAPTMITVL